MSRSSSTAARRHQGRFLKLGEWETPSDNRVKRRGFVAPFGAPWRYHLDVFANTWTQLNWAKPPAVRFDSL